MEENKAISTKINPLRSTTQWWIRQGNGRATLKKSPKNRGLIKLRRKQGALARKK